MTPDLLELAGTLVLGSYFAILLVLAGYGAHRWHLLWLYARHRGAPTRTPEASPDDVPVLTVQLPVYNERYVIERLLEAVAALDWPRDRLDVQVLDDSTDDTTARIEAFLPALRARGLRVTHLHRSDRRGYKAGALAAGLAQTRGDLVAIFDADFVPRPDFLRRLVPHFQDPRVGMVQARWGHLNASHSALTQVQSMLLDGHFVIEHTARHRSGRFFNFNGTAGIWRRQCIEQAGGWHDDTLTEDLDLSYRAQVRGWRFVYLPDEVSPAELPVEMSAFKSQQHRWAKGSIQTARKILPDLLRSALPRRVKAEAVFHLTANVCYALTVMLAVLVVPAVWLRARTAPWTIAAFDLPLFVLSSASVVRFYAVAGRQTHGRWRDVIPWIPALMAVGIGLSLTNARAVWEAVRGRGTEFRRTPKYALGAGEKAWTRRYGGTLDGTTWLELALAIYFGAACAASTWVGLWGAVPFLLLFAVGFGYTAGLAIAQRTQRAMLPLTRAARSPATELPGSARPPRARRVRAR